VLEACTTATGGRAAGDGCPCTRSCYIGRQHAVSHRRCSEMPPTEAQSRSWSWMRAYPGSMAVAGSRIPNARSQIGERELDKVVVEENRLSSGAVRSCHRGE
jgi:hypothetical protein